MNMPWYILACMTLLCNTVYPTIVEISEIESIIPYVSAKIAEYKKSPEYANKKPSIWFAIDLDFTLLKQSHHDATDDFFAQNMKKLTKKGYLKEEALKLTLAEQQKNQLTSLVTPMDDDTVKVIDYLHKNNVRVIALTARGKSMSNITKRQLSDLKINLGTGNWKTSFEFSVPNSKVKAYYDSGVIFCTGNNKGNAMQAFLKHPKINDHIDYFVFIDEQFSNLVNVNNAAEKKDLTKKTPDDNRIKECLCLQLTRVEIDKPTYTEESIELLTAAAPSHMPPMPQAS